MKVLVQQTLILTSVIEVDDDLDDEHQRMQACELADGEGRRLAETCPLNLEWTSSDYFKPDPTGYQTLEDETKMGEWFDIS